MALEIWWTGKEKRDIFEGVNKEYLKRMGRYTKLKVRNFKDSSNKERETKIKEESQAILDALTPESYCILLDETGKELSTMQMTKRLNNKWLTQKKCVLVIGGAFGHSVELKSRADELLSLSQLTLPHLFAKALLIEQIYRCFTIVNNENYHHV